MSEWTEPHFFQDEAPFFIHPSLFVLGTGGNWAQIGDGLSTGRGGLGSGKGHGTNGLGTGGLGMGGLGMG